MLTVDCLQASGVARLRAVLLVVALSVAVAACELGSPAPEEEAAAPGDEQAPRDRADEEDVEEEAVLSEPVDDFDPAPLSPPYSPDSPWNVPVPDEAVIHPDSELYTDRLGDELTSDTTQYTLPVYEVNDDEPTVPVEVVGLFSDVGENGTSHMGEWERTVEAPIPEGTQPATGSDGQVVIVNTDTGEEWGFWQLQRDDDRWTATNGYRYNVRWNGVPPEDFGSRGAGVPYLTGLVRPSEIERGVIEHAIAFAYPTPSPDHVFPATKSDGQGEEELDLPQGARLQLDPTLDDDDFERMGLGDEARIIARALQEYGMIVIDVAGRPKIYAEYEETADWDGAIVEDTVSGIPFSAFRVLDWDSYGWGPLAQPAADAEVPQGSVLTLDGASSYDPDGEILRYEWANSQGDVLGTGEDPRLGLETGGLATGRHVFSLRVENSSGEWSSPRDVSSEIVDTDEPFVVETVEETAREAASLELPEWEPEDEDVLLVAVNVRRLNVEDDAEVAEVVGNGRSWQRVLREADPRGTLVLEVWAAPAGASDAGAIDVRLSSDRNMVAQALRLPDELEVDGGVVAASDEEPTADATLVVPDAADGDLVVGFHAGRAEEFEPESDAEPNVLNTAVDDGGSSLTLSSVVQVAAGDGDVELSGRTRSPMDWLMGAVRLTP